MTTMIISTGLVGKMVLTLEDEEVEEDGTEIEEEDNSARMITQKLKIRKKL